MKLFLTGITMLAMAAPLKAQKIEIPLPVPRPHYEHRNNWRERHHDEWRHRAHEEHRWHHPRDWDDEDEE